MIIQCTKKLLDQMGIQRKWLNCIGAFHYPQGLYDWHANLLSFGGQFQRDGESSDSKPPAVILMNNLTRYPVVMTWSPGLTEKEMREAIAEQFFKEGIHPEIAGTYLEKSGRLVLDRANNKETLIKLRYAGQMANSFAHLYVSDTCLQPAISAAAAREPVRNAIGYWSPAEHLFDALNRMKKDAGLTAPLFDLTHFVFDVSVIGTAPLAEARFQAPANLTLGVLGRLMLHLFGWDQAAEEGFYSNGEHRDKTRELRELADATEMIWFCRTPDGRRWEHRLLRVGIKEHQAQRYAAALARRGRTPDGCRSKSLREINQEFRWLMDCDREMRGR